MVIYVKKKINGRIYENKSLIVDNIVECVTV